MCAYALAPDIQMKFQQESILIIHDILHSLIPRSTGALIKCICVGHSVVWHYEYLF